MPLSILIEQILPIVQAGITTGKAIAQAVRDGRAKVMDASGRVLSPEEVNKHVNDALAAGIKAGQAAEQRIEGRHRDE